MSSSGSHSLFENAGVIGRKARAPPEALVAI